MAMIGAGQPVGRNSTAYCAGRRSNRRNTFRYSALRAVFDFREGGALMQRRPPRAAQLSRPDNDLVRLACVIDPNVDHRLPPRHRRLKYRLVFRGV
jgi:hypothetical protein